MLIEEAEIISELLKNCIKKSIINVCSSDENFWKVQQPYVWEILMEPLLRRDNSITNLDMKNSEGVDIVADCTNMQCIHDRSYDIALFTSGVEHIVEVKKAILEIKRILKPDGFMIGSAPGVYPKHDDPIDTMIRLPNIESWEKILNGNWQVVDFRKTTPIPAKVFYNFKELVYATIIRAIPK